MPSCAKNTIWAAILCSSTLLPGVVYADDIDTEHLFGFMIGTDVGTVGERELQSQTTGSFSKNGGRYRAISQEFELELVPARNFRVEIAGAFAAHDISGVPGIEDRRQLSWQGVSLDLRYRFLDRNTAPFGLTFAVETRTDRFDEVTGAPARSYGTDFTLALERELVSNVTVAAFNLIYRPEWRRSVVTGAAEQESTAGAALGLMAQLRPGFLLGGEMRYLHRYEGIGLEELAGQALFIGPTAYFELPGRSR